MPYILSPEHYQPTTLGGYAIQDHHRYGGCYVCCDACNYDSHRCHFCGTSLRHDSTESSSKRHWLSDCRPDLVPHEIGPDCTWPENDLSESGCYAYQDRDGDWTDKHTHFHTDGPMA